MKNQNRNTARLEAIGQLSGIVSHEFNNIFQGIIGYASFIKKRSAETNPSFAGHADSILNLAERAALLAGIMQKFSMEDDVNPVFVQLHSMLLQNEAMMRSLLGSKIELRFLLCPGDETVFADTLKVQQFLVCIAAMARRTMRTGGAFSVETELCVLENMSPAVVCRLSDCGKAAGEWIPDASPADAGSNPLALMTRCIADEAGFVLDVSAEQEVSLFRMTFPVQRKACAQGETL